MKKHILHFGLLAVLALTSCKQEEFTAPTSSISDIEAAQIKALGFSPDNAIKEEGGYIVEGDIFLTSEDLNRKLEGQVLRVGEEEQYHTTNLVTSLPRTINVFIDAGTGNQKLPNSYIAPLVTALDRYNAENLSLTFERVTSSASANIILKKAPNSAQYLASAGFPTSTGNPHNQVLVNSRAIGSAPNAGYLATILAHEIGHCIGFRHTDYMGRQYSCGGSAVNEGASTVGAIHIPGTPTGPDPNSWMLACIGSSTNRPFNNNDKTALNYLY